LISIRIYWGCNKLTKGQLQEIKDAFYSIPNFKSPGPDGYNIGFFKATWDIVGTLICSAIKEFFQNGVMPHYISVTRLILLPKVPNRETATDFRPISCCNTINA